MKKISVNRMFWISGIFAVFGNLADPITPTFIQNLGLHDYMFGIAFAAMAAAIFVFSPFWGKLSKNIGSSKIMGLGLIGNGMGQAIFGLSTTELGIIMGRAVAGASIAAVIVNQMIYIIKNSSLEDRGRNLAISASIYPVMAPMGYFIGGVVGDYSISLTIALQVVGLCSIGILNWLILDDLPIFEKPNWLKIAQDSNPIRVISSSIGIITPPLISFLLVASFVSFGSISYEQCFNYFIKDQYGFLPSYNGMLKAAMGFVVLFANMSIGMWLLKKTDINKTITYVLLSCAFLMLGIVVIDEIVPFIVINIVFSGFSAISFPMMQSILAKFTKTDGGVIVGLFSSVRSFGMVGGALLAGLIYEFGAKLSFVSSGIAFFISAIFAAIFYRQSKK